MSLKNQVIVGLGWIAVERFAAQGIQFVLSVIIARELIPADFGLIAMLTIFLAVAQSFIDSGFNSALIQKQDRNEIDYSTVFYFNIVIGLIVYCIFCTSSPFIAEFYNQPLLTDIIPYVGISLIINSLSSIQRCIIIINYQFKRQALITVTSTVLSGLIAIYLAKNGYGVWTLVIQGLISGVITSTLLWSLSRWRPKLLFSLKSFKELFGFGSKLLMGGLLDTIYTNIYPLVIGRYFPARDVGLYSKGSTFSQFLSVNITNILDQVVYPTLCKFQNDNKLLTQKFYLILRMSVFAVFPLMLGFASLLEPLIEVILTDKWIDVVPYTQIMCIAFMFSPIKRFSWNILNVKHRSDYSLKSEILKKIIACIILISSIPFGILGICVGLVIYSLVDIIIITRFTKKIIPQINLINHIKSLLPMLLISVIMAFIMKFSITFVESNIYKILIGFIVGLFSYVVLSFIFVKDIFSSFVEFLLIIKNEIFKR